MKKFREKEVIGWEVVAEKYVRVFKERINELMEEYNFEDFQFSVNDYEYVATILLSSKEN